MAAGMGEYRVSVYCNNYEQCDVFCDEVGMYGTIYDLIFNYYATPTVTYSFVPKEGYAITNIDVPYVDACDYEFLSSNKVKITASSAVEDGGGQVNIVVTTAERDSVAPIITDVATTPTVVDASGMIRITFRVIDPE